MPERSGRMPFVWNPKYRVFLCVGCCLSIPSAMAQEAVRKLDKLVVEANQTDDIEQERLDSPVP